MLAPSPPGEAYPDPPPPDSVRARLPIAEHVRYLVCCMYCEHARAGRTRGVYREIARTLRLNDKAVARIVTHYLATGSYNEQERRFGGSHLMLSNASIRVLRETCSTYIMRLAAEGSMVSAKRLLVHLQDESAASDVAAIARQLSYTSFLNYLRRMGFQYSDRRRKKVTSDTVRVRHQEQRDHFLEVFMTNRELPVPERMIEVYQDESYVHQHHHSKLA